MKFLLSLLLIVPLTSCLRKDVDKTSYIIKYGNQEVYTAEFINKMMTLGFVKYGKPFYTKIYDPVFFDKVRSETLEHILNTILMNQLSQKFELKITSDDVQNWIAERAPVYSKEDLIMTLQANNLTYKDWTNLFREQLVQHKISEKLSAKVRADVPKESNNDIKEVKKPEKETHYKIAVLSFENQLDADQAYKQINGSQEKFDESLKKLQSSQQYSWLKEEQIPFFAEVKKLRQGRVSKPFETDWGFLLVRYDGKEKRFSLKKNAANGQNTTEFRTLVEAFKDDPKLQINSDLLYSLKIKR